MNWFTSILLALLVPFVASSQTEAQYSDYIQGLIGGQREVSVPSGRLDLMTKEYAFEIERAAKWKDAIGQSIWYGLQTNKKPGIIILLKSESEYKYAQQLNSAMQYAGLDSSIVVYIYPNDYQNMIDERRAKNSN